jgi:hypothetical protein
LIAQLDGRQAGRGRRRWAPNFLNDVLESAAFEQEPGCALAHGSVMTFPVVERRKHDDSGFASE